MIELHQKIGRPQTEAANQKDLTRQHITSVLLSTSKIKVDALG